jgi:hypothetical protein
MPLVLHGLSVPGTFHLIAWLLLAVVVVAFGCVVAIMLFGDPQRSPLDRSATWMARQLRDDAGKPLIEPWETPSSARKVVSSLYFLGVVGVMLWFATSFMHVR